MASPTAGSLTTTGSVTHTKSRNDSLALVSISGTYGTVTFVFEGSFDATNYFPIVAIGENDGSPVSGTISPSDNTTRAWKVPCEGLSNVRLRTTAVASGQVDVVIHSDTYSAVPFISVSNGSQVLSGSTTFADGANIVVNTTTGTKIGTATSQKLGFFNATPIVQVANTVDYLAGLVNLGLRASGGTADAAFPGGITSSSPTGTGIGYATGAGGTVTQATSITTAVTLNKLSGTITTVSSTLAAGVDASFTLTNSTIAATDVVLVSIKSYAGTSDGIPIAKVQATAAGSCVINLHNQGAVTLDAVIVINFVVIKGVAA